MTMLQNQYDVVHIHYSYGKDIFKLPLEDITKIIIEDVTPIIDEVLKNHQDQKAVFLGKSLGTIPIINGFMKNNMFMDSKMILLTPLLGFDSIFETLLMTNYSSLIVIGEEDEHYIPIKIESINNKANIIIEKIPNANHSLDVEPFNTSMSITSVDKAMKRLDAFLK